MKFDWWYVLSQEYDLVQISLDMVLDNMDEHQFGDLIYDNLQRHGPSVHPR